jgi:hypothetical protein
MVTRIQNQVRIQAQNQGNQMQQHYMQGKVNNVTMDDVWNNPDVILGMFLVNSALTLVVFDLGATHSFVTKQYAAKHHFPTVTMKHPILVC